MKTLKSLIRLPLLLLLLGSGMTAHAQVILQDEGEVLSLNNRYIIINDTQHAISPTVKVKLPNDKVGKLDHIKTGSFVSISVIKINKRRYVDTIEILDNTLPDKR